MSPPSDRIADPAARGPGVPRLPVVVHPSAAAACSAVANDIAALVRQRTAAGLTTVLGLPTGRTPRAVYDELARQHRDEGLSFHRVVTFNLDEYWPLPAADPHSYHAFMERHLFARVDVDPAARHLPDGELPPEDVAAFCAGYERAIARAGGIDLLLLGIGRNGHLAFNEPGSMRASRTQLVALHAITRADATADFGSEAGVPEQAITMGLATLLEARRILLLACGPAKAGIVRQALAGPVTEVVPASLLQEHGDVCAHLDPEAAGELQGMP